MADKNLPTAEYLRKALAYDPDAGTLTWRIREDARPQWNSRFAGKPAFTFANAKGYPTGRINNQGFLAHRVAWAIYYGEWPEQEVDHINGDPGNYRIANLRAADRFVNMRNARKPSSNTSGFVGVVWYKHYGKWLAQVNLRSGRVFLGYFDKKEDAIAARKAANERLGFHENHGRDARENVA